MQGSYCYIHAWVMFMFVHVDTYMFKLGFVLIVIRACSRTILGCCQMCMVAHGCYWHLLLLFLDVSMLKIVY